MRYGFTNILHIFSMEYKICTDKLCAVAAAHFLIAKWSVHVCHYKGFTCSKHKHSGEHKHNIVATVSPMSYVATNKYMVQDMEKKGVIIGFKYVYH